MISFEIDFSLYCENSSVLKFGGTIAKFNVCLNPLPKHILLNEKGNFTLYNG